MVQRILLIDDDEDDREFFSLAVREVNPAIEVGLCNTGVEALEKLRKEREKLPDIIFLDINMPQLNGIETYKELKQIEHLQYIPVVIYSTSGREMDLLKGLGADHFLVKPHRLRILEQELKKLLGQY